MPRNRQTGSESEALERIVAVRNSPRLRAAEVDGADYRRYAISARDITPIPDSDITAVRPDGKSEKHVPAEASITPFPNRRIS